MKIRICCLLVTAAVLLSGCSALLDRSYSTVEPHADRYWEEAGSDILRAESYQDIVNTLLLLLERHDESGLLRLYLTDVDYKTASNMMKRAIVEVREETAIGSFVLSDMSFYMEELRNSYYQVLLTPVYRRSVEELTEVEEIATSSAVYDMILAAREEGLTGLTVRYAHLAEEEEELLENIRLLQAELEGVELLSEPRTDSGIPDLDAVGQRFPEGTELWTVHFYPPRSRSSILEITFPAAP